MKQDTSTLDTYGHTLTYCVACCEVLVVVATCGKERAQIGFDAGSLLQRSRNAQASKKANERGSHSLTIARRL